MYNIYICVCVRVYVSVCVCVKKNPHIKVGNFKDSSASYMHFDPWLYEMSYFRHTFCFSPLFLENTFKQVISAL